MLKIARAEIARIHSSLDAINERLAELERLNEDFAKTRGGAAA